MTIFPDKNTVPYPKIYTIALGSLLGSACLCIQPVLPNQTTYFLLILILIMTSTAAHLYRHKIIKVKNTSTNTNHKNQQDNVKQKDNETYPDKDNDRDENDNEDESENKDSDKSLIFFIFVRFREIILRTIFNKNLFFLMLSFVFSFMYAAWIAHGRLNHQLTQAIYSTEKTVQLTILEDKSSSNVLGNLNSSMINKSNQSSNVVHKYIASYQNESNQMYKVQLLVKDQGKLISFSPNQRVIAKGIFKRPYRHANPGSFDVEKQFFMDNLKGIFIAKEVSLLRGENQVNKSNIKNLDLFVSLTINSVRHKIAKNIENVKGLVNAPVLKALSLGLKNDIPKATLNTFSKTGTSHLLAISGLHVGLISAMVLMLSFIGLKCLFFLVKAKEHWWDTIPKLSAINAITAAFVYSAFAGFPISCIRALIMICVFLGLSIFEKQSQLPKALAIALIVCIILDPFCPLSMGFWLSFWAVFCICLAMQRKVIKNTSYEKWGRFHLVLFFGLLPMTLICFNTAPIISPLANLISIPLFSIVTVPCSLLGVILLTANQSLGACFLMIADKSLSFLLKLLNVLMTLDFPVYPKSLDGLSITLAFLGAVVMLSPMMLGIRAIGGLAMLPLLMGLSTQDKYAFKIHFLDVGQGSALLIQTQHHNILYDVGPSDMITLSTLQSLGLRPTEIDQIIVSHNDYDHIGALPGLLKYYKTNNILGSEQSYKAIQMQPCEGEQEIIYDNVHFKMLHPTQRLQYDDNPSKARKMRNNRSCVVKISMNHNDRAFRVLLPGDIETQAENQLLENYSKNELKSDLLLVPHHGSKTSSSQAFIEAVSPNYAVYTTGFQNKYGFPHLVVIDRYKALKIRSYNTTQSGFLSFVIDLKGNLKIHEYKSASKRFYHFS